MEEFRQLFMEPYVNDPFYDRFFAIERAHSTDHHR